MSGIAELRRPNVLEVGEDGRMVWKVHMEHVFT